MNILVAIKREERKLEKQFGKVAAPVNRLTCTADDLFIFSFRRLSEGEYPVNLRTKQRQQNDIKLALERWDDFKQNQKQQKETKEE